MKHSIFTFSAISHEPSKIQNPQIRQINPWNLSNLGSKYPMAPTGPEVGEKWSFMKTVFAFSPSILWKEIESYCSVHLFEAQKRPFDYKLKPTSFFNIYRYYLPPIGAIWESDRSITNLQFKASRIDLEQKIRVNAHFKI